MGSNEILLVALAFFTATFSGAIGMGGGILLLGGMTFLMPLGSIVPLHGLIQLGSNGTRSFLLRKHIGLWIIFPFAGGAVLGGGLSYSIIRHFGLNDGFLILVFAVIVYVLFKPKKLPDLQLNRIGFFCLGVVGGAVGPIIGATGPLIAPFFLRKDLDQKEIVASKAACQIFIHLIKIPIFLLLDFSFEDSALLIVSLLVVTYLGNRLGISLLERINRKLFFKVFKVALFVVLCRLTWKLAIYYGI